MSKDPFKEIPIRAKVTMAQEIAKIMTHLQKGEAAAARPAIEDLRAKALLMDESIQQAVMSFVEQVEFLYSYDPSRGVTQEVSLAADKLIEALGFVPPP